MAFRPLLRSRTILPGTLAAAAAAAATLLIPTTTLHAESPPPPELSTARKPIYDNPWPRTPQKPIPSPSEHFASPHASPPSPTLTDRFAARIRAGRLFLHAHTAAAEDGVNNLMTRALHLENSFTSTIASLAPAPETHERLLPGALYVLVAAMAGSIITRNRTILLRATVPVAVGIGAGYMVLPYTMRNVADLVWTYERKSPVIATNHMRIRGAVVQGIREARESGKRMGDWTDEKVRNGREALEGWVRRSR